MRTAKEEAAALIHSLPDDVSLEDIQYRLYVLEKVRAGLAEVEAGDVVSHQDVRAGLSRWLAD